MREDFGGATPHFLFCNRLGQVRLGQEYFLYYIRLGLVGQVTNIYFILDQVRLGASGQNFFYFRLGQVRQRRFEIFFSYQIRLGQVGQVKKNLILDQESLVRLGQVRLGQKYFLYQIRLGQVGQVITIFLDIRLGLVRQVRLDIFFYIRLDQVRLEMYFYI